MTQRISKRLSMRDVARMAGYVDDNGNVNRCHRVRALRHLRRLEEQTGRKLVWIDRGRKAWTTLQALRMADPALVESTRALAETVDVLIDRVDDHTGRHMATVEVLKKMEARLQALESLLFRPRPRPFVAV